MAEYTDHLYADTFPYVTPAEVIACCSAASEMEEDDPILLDAIEDASTVLYYLTGKQFAGTRRTTVRPDCLSGACACGCTPAQVNLGVWPVTGLISVRYQGQTYTGSDLTDTFHVNDWHYLARNDGDAFESGNQWALSGGEFDTLDDGYVFEVTVDYGLAIPRLLSRAARSLACEWVQQNCGSGGPCKLPQRTTQVSRSGISMDIASASDILRNGNTGIYEVDLAIQVFNPSKLQSPSFVWHPQGSRTGRRVNT